MTDSIYDIMMKLLEDGLRADDGKRLVRWLVGANTIHKMLAHRDAFNWCSFYGAGPDTALGYPIERAWDPKHLELVRE